MYKPLLMMRTRGLMGPIPFKAAKLTTSLVKSAGAFIGVSGEQPVVDPPIACANVIYASHLDTDIINEGTDSPVVASMANGAEISTALSKFGVGSGLFPAGGNGGNYMGLSNLTDSSTFTLQCFISIRDIPVPGILSGIFRPNSASMILYVDAINDKIGVVIGIYLFTEAPFPISINEWSHVALVVDGLSVKVYLDGVLVIDTVSNDPVGLSGTVFVGSGLTSADVEDFGGYIDDIIFTNTIDITGDFTPPTAPFETTCASVVPIPCANVLYASHFDEFPIVEENSSYPVVSQLAAGAVVDATKPLFGAMSISTVDATGALSVSVDYADQNKEVTYSFWLYLDPAFGLIREFWYTDGNRSRCTTNFEGRVDLWVGGSSTTITENVPIQDAWNHFEIAQGIDYTEFFFNGKSVLHSNAVLSDSGSIPRLNQLGVKCGFIDEVLIVKGITHTEDFTPPTEPFETTCLPPPPAPIDCATIIYASHVDTNISNINTTNGVFATLGGDAAVSSADSKFGASSAYVPLGNDANDLLVNSDLLVANAKTIQVFFKVTEPSEASHYNGILSIFDVSIGVFINYITENGQLQARVGGLLFTSSTIVSVGVWHHVAVTTNNGVDTKIYFDGELIITAQSQDIGGATTVTAGNGKNAYGSKEFGGYIDEILITNTTDYTENFTPPPVPFTTTC